MRPVEHTVKQGECLLSVSARHGFHWETLWNHPKNSNLKQKRNDPSVLLPGDTIFIPEKNGKAEDCAVDQLHGFRRKGLPAYLKIRLLKDGRPRRNLHVTIEIDGVTTSEATDSDGFLNVPVPPNAQSGKLYLGESEPYEEYDIRFRTVDPIDTEEGIRSRLHNMGYPVEDGLEPALRAFQQKEGLEATGQPNADTVERLKAAFGK